MRDTLFSVYIVKNAHTHTIGRYFIINFGSGARNIPMRIHAIQITIMFASLFWFLMAIRVSSEHVKRRERFLNVADAPTASPASRRRFAPACVIMMCKYRNLNSARLSCSSPHANDDVGPNMHACTHKRMHTHRNTGVRAHSPPYMFML